MSRHPCYLVEVSLVLAFGACAGDVALEPSTSSAALESAAYDCDNPGLMLLDNVPVACIDATGITFPYGGFDPGELNLAATRFFIRDARGGRHYGARVALDVTPPLIDVIDASNGVVEAGDFAFLPDPHDDRVVTVGLHLRADGFPAYTASSAGLGDLGAPPQERRLLHVGAWPAGDTGYWACCDFTRPLEMKPDVVVLLLQREGCSRSETSSMWQLHDQLRGEIDGVVLAINALNQAYLKGAISWQEYVAAYALLQSQLLSLQQQVAEIIARLADCGEQIWL